MGGPSLMVNAGRTSRISALRPPKALTCSPWAFGSEPGILETNACNCAKSFLMERATLYKKFMVNLLRKLREVAARPWFAYLTMFLLQMKVLWGIWDYRDLTPGDTTSYYCIAYFWFE